MDSLAAAHCRICMNKILYFKGNSTRNLHKHMSKRHSWLFAQQITDGSNVNGDTSRPPQTIGEAVKRLFRGNVL